ncbi:MAG TPA: extracellular solute-binding protein [Candidatus Ozemobacteraceae bacterium]|nr:extracellular solute-binding protein [Candidatus Ozemobacteraceae bacterium]
MNRILSEMNAIDNTPADRNVIFFTPKSAGGTGCRLTRGIALLVLLLMLVCAGRASAVEIEIWDYPRWLEPGETIDRFAWMKKQIRAFEAENPGIRVRLTELTWNRGDEKLKIAALGGRFPDIAPGTVPLLFIREGLIEPMDAYLEPGDREDYLPGALDAYTVDGKLYGWPWYMGGQLLFVNRSTFASAGVDLPPNGRWTPETFVEKLTRVKAWQQGRDGQFPLGIYFQKNETANFPFILQFGGTWPGMEAAGGAEAVDITSGIEWLRGLIDRGLIPADSGGRQSNDIWTAFARERRIAAGAFGLWGIKALTDKYPMDFELMHFPAPAGRPSGSFLGISGLYLFHRDDPVRMKAAVKFARYITGAARQRDLVRYTQFPTRRSAGNIYAGNRHMTRAWEILQEGRTVPTDARWPQMDEEIEQAVQNALLGRVSAPTAVREAGHRISALMDRHQGSVTGDIRSGSLFGKAFLWLFPIVLAAALCARQAHLLMLLPAVTVLGLFLVYPLLDAFLLAFRDYRLGEVGGFTLGNFRRVFSDTKFVQACWNTGLYTLVVVSVNTATALIAASLIHALSGRLKSIYRALYYLPGVASVVVISMVWRWLFNTEVGLFNTVLRAVGLPAVGWLTNPDVAFVSVLLTGILRSPGGAILIYLAALGNIPKSLYEAADLEGASPLQRWWHITVPLLKQTTMFLLITGAIDGMQVFAQVLMLTDGGPGSATEVIVHRVYTAAFRDFDFGLSSAMALLLFAGILTVTLLQRRFGGQTEMELA